MIRELDRKFASMEEAAKHLRQRAETLDGFVFGFVEFTPGTNLCWQVTTFVQRSDYQESFYPTTHDSDAGCRKVIGLWRTTP